MPPKNDAYIICLSGKNMYYQVNKDINIIVFKLLTCKSYRTF